MLLQGLSVLYAERSGVWQGLASTSHPLAVLTLVEVAPALNSSSVHPMETTVQSDDFPNPPDIEETPSLGCLDPSHPMAIQSRSQHKFLFNGWRQRARIIDALWTSGDEDLEQIAVKMGCCCQYPFLSSFSDGTVRPTMMTCHKRGCPHCNQMRSAKLQKQAAAAVLAMDSPRFLTLTLASSDRPLADELKRMRKSFANLRRSQVWKQCVEGGVYGVEVTRNNRTGEWHPHIHIIIDGTYMPHADVKNAWLKATGDSAIVDIRAVSSRRNLAHYITKYILKGNTSPTSDGGKFAPVDTWPYHAIRELFGALAGMRLLQTFGSLHGKQLVRPDSEIKPQRDRILCSTIDLAGAAEQGDAEAKSIIEDVLRFIPRTAQCFGYDPRDCVSCTVNRADEVAPSTLSQIAQRLWHWRSTHYFDGHRFIYADSHPPPLPDTPQRPLWGRQDNPGESYDEIPV